MGGISFYRTKIFYVEKACFARFFINPLMSLGRESSLTGTVQVSYEIRQESNFIHSTFSIPARNVLKHISLGSIVHFVHNVPGAGMSHR